VRGGGVCAPFPFLIISFLFQPSTCDMLAILAVPPAMAVSDLCAFLGDHLAHVRELRLVRRRVEAAPVPPPPPPPHAGGGPPPPLTPLSEESEHAPTLALLRFASPAEAATFYTTYQGLPFTALEPGTVCRLLPVRSVEFLGRNGGGGETTPAAAAAAAADLTAAPPPGQTELPACPVCLERLDDHITGGGTLTTVCGHVFHSSCMQRWAGASCPVCRHCTSGSASSTRCAACGSRADLWICLLCGHVGCGRYRAGHAAGHFHETCHTYALELESQRVWDYAADGYVHRLIQSSAADGKLVEVSQRGAGGGGGGGGGPARGWGGGGVGGGPSGSSGRAATATAAAAGAATSRSAPDDDICCPGGGGHDQSPSLEPALDADTAEAILESKADAMAAQFSHLLVSQLDAQRAYFEGSLATAEAGTAAATARAEAAEEAAAVAKGAAAAASSRAAEEKARSTAARDKAASLERRLSDTSRRADTTSKERDELRALNDALLRTAAELRAKLAEAGTELADLREQVRDLMMALDAGARIAAGGGGDGAGGTLLPVPALPPPQRRAMKKR